MLCTYSENKRQFYLEHLSDLGPLLCRVLRLNEQLLQQWLFVKLTHQFTLQVLFHIVHQEVHHCLRHAVDTTPPPPEDSVWKSASIIITELSNREKMGMVRPRVLWTRSSQTCLGCFYGQWGSSTWWAAGWPRSPSAPSHSACGIQALPGGNGAKSNPDNSCTNKYFVFPPVPPLTVSRRLMAWPLLGLPKPAAGPFSSFSFFQRFPPSRASAWQRQIPAGERVKAISSWA